MGLFGYQRKASRSSVIPTSFSSIPSSPPIDDAVQYKLGIDGMIFPLTPIQDKEKTGTVKGTDADDSIHGNSQPSSSRSIQHLSPCLQNTVSGRTKHLTSKSGLHVTLEHIPDLILDLESAVETSAKRPARALLKLFALSEPLDRPNGKNHNRNRIEMVHRFNNQNNRQDAFQSDTIHTGALIPALFQFLMRCKNNSYEQFLSLLILNNISIPMENKRVREIESMNGCIFDVFYLFSFS
jgi:hypothetical protein